MEHELINLGQDPNPPATGVLIDLTDEEESAPYPYQLTTTGEVDDTFGLFQSKPQPQSASFPLSNNNNNNNNNNNSASANNEQISENQQKAIITLETPSPILPLSKSKDKPKDKEKEKENDDDLLFKVPDPLIQITPMKNKNKARSSVKKEGINNPQFSPRSNTSISSPKGIMEMNDSGGSHILDIHNLSSFSISDTSPSPATNRQGQDLKSHNQPGMFNSLIRKPKNEAIAQKVQEMFDAASPSKNPHLFRHPNGFTGNVNRTYTPSRTMTKRESFSYGTPKRQAASTIPSNKNKAFGFGLGTTAKELNFDLDDCIPLENGNLKTGGGSGSGEGDRVENPALSLVVPSGSCSLQDLNANAFPSGRASVSASRTSLNHSLAEINHNDEGNSIYSLNSEGQDPQQSLVLTPVSRSSSVRCNLNFSRLPTPSKPERHSLTSTASSPGHDSNSSFKSSASVGVPGSATKIKVKVQPSQLKVQSNHSTSTSTKPLGLAVKRSASTSVKPLKATHDILGPQAEQFKQEQKSNRFASVTSSAPVHRKFPNNNRPIASSSPNPNSKVSGKTLNSSTYGISPITKIAGSLSSHRSSGYGQGQVPKITRTSDSHSFAKNDLGTVSTLNVDDDEKPSGSKSRPGSAVSSAKKRPASYSHVQSTISAHWKKPSGPGQSQGQGQSQVSSSTAGSSKKPTNSSYKSSASPFGYKK